MGKGPPNSTQFLEMMINRYITEMTPKLRDRYLYMIYHNTSFEQRNIYSKLAEVNKRNVRWINNRYAIMSNHGLIKHRHPPNYSISPVVWYAYLMITNIYDFLVFRHLYENRQSAELLDDAAEQLTSQEFMGLIKKYII